MQQKIRFDELEHKYFLNDGTSEKELVSVTTLLKKHGLTPDYSFVNEVVLSTKAERGTIVHKELEAYIKSNEVGFTSELENFINTCNTREIVPQQSEFIVFNDEIAGTVDIKGLIENQTFLGDFKTTSSLDKNAVAWQLSLYQYLTGEKFDKLICFHFKDEENLKIIELTPISEEEIKKLLECERNFVLYERKTLEIDFIDSEKILAVQRALKTLDAQKKELEAQENEIKEVLLKKMEENQVKSIDNDLFKITYVDSFSRESVDSTRLKKEKPEIAAEYTKSSTVKASVRITLKADQEKKRMVNKNE